RQARDANAGVAFVANVKANQERGDLLEDTRVFQFAAVDGADLGNFCRQRSYSLGGGAVIAADNDVAVDGSIAIQNLRGSFVEGGHYRNSLGHEFGGLLRRGALPDAEGAGGPATDAGRKRHRGV